MILHVLIPLLGRALQKLLDACLQVAVNNDVAHTLVQLKVHWHL